MPMYADLLEAARDEPLDFKLPYDQPETKAGLEAANETELLAEELYGDGEKAPADLKRVYLLEDHAPVLQDMLGKKRKRELDTVEEADEHVDEDDDKRRPNALLLHGEPISKLSTEKIFEYVAMYCDEPPTSLEWVDDRSTVIIFDSPKVAQSSLTALAKSLKDDPTASADSLIIAHPVPKKMWPPEAQLDHNLSRGTALSGIMRLRWARFGDRKLRDARKRSEYYQVQREDRGRNKRTRGEEGDERWEKGMDLDAELDEMRRRREAGEDGDDSSRRRAAELDEQLDALAQRGDGDEQIDRLPSSLSQRLGPKKDRPIAPLPRRRGRGGDSDGRRREGDRASHERPKRTQDDLDAELEAFMKDRA
ncbi:hypothetical protein BDV93DRAFT_59726 [Ceratobasidium sp. AG-I]|nr:hypothetical protein BDV93DRAFT_59726 [Ceratobasidium sp. AG-I]